ncbi:SPOR domain-containing protein [Montanilutibacter psychrotolerans]|nr:SPOR domain-containing protein [Lysobacter psychrotolerans]
MSYLRVWWLAMKRTGRGRYKEGVPVSVWLLVGVLGVALAIFRDGPPAFTNMERSGGSEPQGKDTFTPIEASPTGVLLPHALQLEAVGASSMKYDSSTQRRTASLLMVGPFPSGLQAEALKARIALLAYVSRIETYQQDGRTLYRLRLGPYATTTELDDVKRRLAEDGIESLAVAGQ